MDINTVGSSAPVQAQISVQKSAMKSDEKILNKIYGSISEIPTPRAAGHSTGHNLNIKA